MTAQGRDGLLPNDNGNGPAGSTRTGSATSSVSSLEFSSVTLTSSPSTEASTTGEPTTSSKFGSTLGLNSTTNGTLTSGTIPTFTLTTSSESVPTSLSTTASGASSGNSLPTGAIAGIAIGSAIAGAILAALAVFFLCARRRRKDSHRPVSMGYGEVNASGRRLLDVQSPDAVYSQIPTPSTLGVVEKAIPMVITKENATVGFIVDEHAVRQPWALLETRIRQHAQSMYHLSPIAGGAIALSDVEAVHPSDSKLSASHLLEFLLEPGTRISAVCFLLASAICPRLDFFGDPRNSFLPPEIVSCMNTTDVSTASKDTLSEWRSLTASLLSTHYPPTPTSIPRSDPRSTALSSCLNTLIPILRPLIPEPSGIAQAFEDLEELLEEAAAFGLVLFASRASWAFSGELGEKAFVERGEVPGWPGLTRTDVERVVVRRSLFREGTFGH